jgi:hypothetical protein
LKNLLAPGAFGSFQLQAMEGDAVELDAKVFTEEQLAYCRKALDEIYATWRVDLTGLTAVVSSWCPSWQPFVRSNDLLKPDLVKQLLQNPQYPKITPGANMLDVMLNTARALQRDTFGCVFSAEDVKAAVTARDLGYDTVSLTYTLHVLTTKLPGLATQKEKIAEISTLRAKLKEKGFSIPAPIDERLIGMEGKA